MTPRRHAHREGTQGFMIDLIIQMLVLAGVLAAAFGLINWAKRADGGDKAANMGLYLLFGIPGGLLTVAGAALLVNGNDGGWLAMGLGLGMGLPMLRRFREVMAQVSPMDPKSPIDFSGLAIIFSIIAFLLYTLLTTTGDEAAVEELGSGELVTSLVVNFLTFVGLAYIAVGYRNYRTAAEATARLGLRKPTVKEIGIGLAAVVPAFIFSMTGSLLTSIFQPEVVDRLAETIDTMTSGIDNPAGALLLGLTTGIGEEVLFRGAIQPRFGIALTTVLWTLLHTQYELTWVIVALLLMGIMLGLIRKHFGTTAAIITHAVYNAIVVLIQLAI
jgi:membrane protease YdiL (CAAX protease family)